MVDENHIFLSDEDLCRLASQGDLTAVETLYKRHYALLVNYGLKFNPDLGAVEDAVQSLFVNLISRPARWSGVTTSVRAWLLISLRNLIFRQIKADLRNVSFDEVFSLSVDIPEADEADGDRERRVSDALRRLSGRQRQALYLFYVKGLSHDEIGQMLNINAQSSMNLLSRTRDKLRKLLKLCLSIIF